MAGGTETGFGRDRCRRKEVQELTGSGQARTGSGSHDPNEKVDGRTTEVEEEQ